MAVAGDIIREFGVKVSLLFDSKKIDQAEGRIKKFASELKTFAMGVAATSAALFESQNLFTTNARSLQNQADMLGVTTEKLQEYEYAAKVAANVNREDLVGSMEALATTMDKARAGDVEARQALENIGGAMGDQSAIIQKLNDKNYTAAEAMKDVSGGIEKISKSSPIAAKRLLEVAMGSDKLYNLMRQGPKVLDQLTAEGKKNFALSDQMIKQGYEMDVTISKLWLSFRKMGYEIGYHVMKSITPLINAFMKWYYANRKLILSGINAFLEVTAESLQFVFNGMLLLWSLIEPVIKGLGGMKNAMMLLAAVFLPFSFIPLAITFAGIAASLLLFLPGLVLVTALGVAFSTLGIFVTGVVAAIGLVIAGFHDLISLAMGGALKDTWISKGIDTSKAGISWIGDKVKSFTGGSDAIANQTVGPSPLATGGGGTPVTQENHFHTENNITVPEGTTANAASAMIAKASTDSHENMMVKAKMDAARSKVY